MSSAAVRRLRSSMTSFLILTIMIAGTDSERYTVAEIQKVLNALGVNMNKDSNLKRKSHTTPALTNVH